MLTSESAAKAAPPVTHLTDSIDKALDHNVELFTEMTRFTKGETFRFASKRLEHTEQAVEQFHACQGISGLLHAQHEWLRAIMQDYTDQSLRYAELFRTLGMNAQSHARAVAEDIGEKAKAEMKDLDRDAHKAADGQMPAAQAYNQAGYQPQAN
jgi:hypothetical protein